MGKKTKSIIAIIAVIIILAVAFFIWKNHSNSYTTSDLYNNMEWGMSPGAVKSKAIDLGETWEDIPIDLSEKIVYKAEGTTFDGKEDIDYKIMYIFKEEKLWSVYIKFDEEYCDANMDKLFKDLSKGFNEKYEKSTTFDTDEEGVESWESDRTLISLYQYSEDQVTLVYENIEVQKEFQ